MIANEQLSPNLWRIPLPSRTMPPFEHTNSYLLAQGGVGLLVDVGGDSDEAFEALHAALKAAGVGFLKVILLTHTHPDHCAGVARAQAEFDAPPVYVHPNELARLEHPQLQALNGDRNLTVGDLLVQSLFTPGHSPGHLSFYLPEEGILLAGDLIAGYGSTWVGVPEGNVQDYLRSLEQLGALELSLIAPGHGEVIRNPYERLADAKKHRLEREKQLLSTLGRQQKQLTELREAIYPKLTADMHDLAERSLLAHLQKLMAEMKVLHLGNDEQGPYRVRK